MRNRLLLQRPQILPYQRGYLITMLVLLALTGCINPFKREGPPSEPFLPPSSLPSATPEAIIRSTDPTTMDDLEITPSQPDSPCTNVLAYAADLSIPDGTIVKPGEIIEKRWQVKNSGTCDWNGRYRMILTEGQAMGVPEEQALFPALAGTEAKVRMLLTAPLEPGPYLSAWQAMDPDGQLFGDPIYIEIIVSGE